MGVFTQQKQGNSKNQLFLSLSFSIFFFPESAVYKHTTGRVSLASHSL